MITAVDTNILLDILIPNPSFLESSKSALNHHHTRGELILGEVVYAELATQFEEEALLKSFLIETGIRQVSSDSQALWLASRSWKKYNQQKKKNRTLGSRRVLADFLVGAHAMTLAGRLITRDKGFYRAYFHQLKIIEP